MKCWFILCLFLVNAFAKEETYHFRFRAPKIHQLKNPQYTAADIEAEIKFGRGLAARILTKYPLVNNPKLQKYVNTLGAGLAAQVGRPELTFYFGVIDTNDVNAYACPGGYILLTQGLMNLLDNESELVGVLAHEIAHVNERHVIKKLKIKGQNEDSLSGIGAMVGGATASLRLAIKTITEEAMNLLFEEGLSKTDETESDKFALRAIHALGYKISSFKDLLQKLKSSMESQNAKVLSKTHPKIDDRMKLVDIFEKKVNVANNTKTNQERFKLYVNR